MNLMDSDRIIEPVGPSHVREHFCSGSPELDRYLHQQATQDARRKVAAVFMLADRRKHVLGFYTLSACSIQPAELPPAIARRLPRYPHLPATLLGRLAVELSRRGLRLGQFLLMDALYRSWRNTLEIASVAVVVDAIDDNARRFYAHHEFQPFADHPNRLFLPMTTIEKLFTSTSK